jgi:glycine/D-amino acid oxidase-like deaminating enzyme
VSSPPPANTPVWDDLRWAGLPSLTADISTDVCVVGLGGSGLTAVEELVAMGRRVVGIDAADVGAGAAGRNGGLLLTGTADYHHDAVASLGHDCAMRIHDMTVAEMQLIAAQAPGTVRYTGSLRLADTDEELADCIRQRDAMRSDSLVVEEYDGPMGRGIFIPLDATFNPLARCRALAARLVNLGAHLFSGTPALSFGDGHVVTPRGRIHCEQVIVAVDGRLESLLPELIGVVRTARLQMIATAPTHEVSLPCPVSARNGFDYWQQLPDGSIALGGGRDTRADEEWTQSGEPTPVMREYLEGVLRTRLRVRAPVTHHWAANVSYSSTPLPLLAEVRPRLWAIGGYSGTGNVIGALAGRAVARRACGEESEFAALLSTHAHTRSSQWSPSV